MDYRIADSVQVTEAEIRSLTESIFARYGLDFTCYEPKSLRRRIIRVLNLFNMGSVHELWRKILEEPAFVQTFMNEVSVGMTSMFRDPVLWRSLGRLLREGNHAAPLRVWHAGCSTGEEVYSMAILLKDVGRLNQVEAHCTDISQQAMREAQKGTYHKIKMIENETNYREFNHQGSLSKYYTSEAHHVQFDPSLIHHARFYYHNLITDPFPGGFDIVLCRNVMIYFDNAAKVRLLDKFHQAIKPGGLFIIGFFDTLGSLLDSKHFKAVDESAKIFQRME